jgi:hypothetical protein
MPRLERRADVRSGNHLFSAEAIDRQRLTNLFKAVPGQCSRTVANSLVFRFKLR